MSASARPLAVMALSLLLLLPGCRPQSSTDTAGDGTRCADCNVVLISIDTLRADHLGCYGYARPTSPALDAFARQATRFTQAVNTGGGTLPIHMSMMTSLPPTVHGVWPESGRQLDDARTTLAEELRAGGYTTAGFTDNGWMLGKFGFGQGFDVYDDKGGHLRKILPRLYGWLEKNRSKKFFLFLHTYDVHSAYHRLPYDPPQPYRDLYTAGYDGPFWGCLQGKCASQLLQGLNTDFFLGRRKREDIFAEKDLAYLIALYDGGITYADHEIGEFLGKLRGLDLERNTIVVITSDHGEEFLEHGQLLHNQSYEEIAHVPLLIRFPGRTVEPRASSTLVSTLDLMPTVLAAVGLEVNPEARGRSLMPVILGKDEERPPVLLAGLTPTQKWKLRDRRWSLLEFADAPIELYDLESDPGERTNVLSRFPAAAEEMHAKLAQMHQTEVAFLGSLGETEEPKTAITEEETERLKALGYIN